MENISDQINIIKKYIKRALDQGQAYSYEVTLVEAKGKTELVARTSGLDSFDTDMNESVESAKQMRGELEVKVFSGKSNNASVKNTYAIAVSGSPEKEDTPDMRQMIREELQSIIPNQKPVEDGLGSLNSLVGALTGKSDSKDGLAGLMGLASSLAAQNSSVAVTQTKHELNLFKSQTKIDTLTEKYNGLVARYRVVSSKLKRSQTTTEEQEKNIKELEEQLAGYAPNELMRRMATGVVSKIGSNLLGNEKVARAIGVTEEELKGALGLIDTPAATITPAIESAPVQISAVEEPRLSPEDQAKKDIINEISIALNSCSLPIVKQVYHILNVSMSSQLILNNVEKMIVKLETISDKKTVEGADDLEENEELEED